MKSLAHMAGSELICVWAAGSTASLSVGAVSNPGADQRTAGKGINSGCKYSQECGRKLFLKTHFGA